ncbi:MAG: poly-gamma-glutamate hydrolase family protein [Actinomycetota bacterium]
MSEVTTATSLSELLAEPMVVERCELLGRVGVIAYHGGNLEWLTDVIADHVSAATGASLYSIVQPPGMRRHLASTRMRPDESPALASFLAHVDIVVTLHGFGRRGLFDALLLGGRNRTFAEHVGQALRRHLPVYRVLTELDRIPPKLRGQHEQNPVNLPAQAGVQIELPPRVRGSSPMWWDWEGPQLTPHTLALIDGLVEAIRTWPDAAR